MQQQRERDSKNNTFFCLKCSFVLCIEVNIFAFSFITGWFCYFVFVFFFSLAFNVCDRGCFLPLMLSFRRARLSWPTLTLAGRWLLMHLGMQWEQAQNYNKVRRIETSNKVHGKASRPQHTRENQRIHLIFNTIPSRSHSLAAQKPLFTHATVAYYLLIILQRKQPNT